MNTSLTRTVIVFAALFILAVPTVAIAADPPQPIKPSYDSYNIPMPVQFGWTDDLTYVQFYQLQISDNFVFADTVVDTVVYLDTCTVNGLEVGTMYFWHVRALYLMYIGGGNWVPVYTNWSIDFYFRTCDNLGALYQMLAPINGSTDEPLPVYFEWAPVSGANRYYLQVDNDLSFSSPEIDLMLGAIGGDHYTAYGLEPGMKYYWRIRAQNACFEGAWSAVSHFTVSNPTDVAELGPPERPERFVLHQNYPNPFNLETRIEFDLPVAGVVELEIFNVLGQSVRTLVSEPLNAGLKSVAWDGRDKNGMVVPSGLYLYRMTMDGFTDTKTMLLLK